MKSAAADTIHRLLDLQVLARRLRQTQPKEKQRYSRTAGKLLRRPYPGVFASVGGPRLSKTLIARVSYSSTGSAPTGVHMEAHGSNTDTETWT